MIEENNDREELKTILYKTAGAILGFIFVKAIIFNAEDDFLWHMFWGTLFSGELQWKQVIDEVIMTWTALKLTIGVIVGEFLGGMIAKGTIQKFIQDVKTEVDNEEDNDKK